MKRLAVMRQTELESDEARRLSPIAMRSADATRRRPEGATGDDLRLSFQRDRDRILHARAFRRLKHKTQVFVPHVGDHPRTRLTHTLEVGQLARTVARALRLNEDLAEAVQVESAESSHHKEDRGERDLTGHENAHRASACGGGRRPTRAGAPDRSCRRTAGRGRWPPPPGHRATGRPVPGNGPRATGSPR